MDQLPAELVLHIISFLPIRSITHLEIASRRYQKIVADNELWKFLCFSQGLQTVSKSFLERKVLQLQRVIARSSTVTDASHHSISPQRIEDGGDSHMDERIWDSWPKIKVFNSTAHSPLNHTTTRKKIDWRSEYIARHAGISFNWLEQPVGELYSGQECLESKGVGFVDETTVLAPLADGSICLWDIEERGEAYGMVKARSRSGLLHIDSKEKTRTWQKPSTSLPSNGIVECVSIDRMRNKGFVAIQADLVEVDLTSFAIVSRKRYPQPISVLSEIAPSVPMTIGTTQAVHIHDSRLPKDSKLLSASVNDCISGHDDFCRVHAIDPESAVLSQPLPLSILHLGMNMIHVAGRFPSILSYDRRFFPQIASTVHSGARLSCITSFSSNTGQRLAAVGEYNGKGSLEIYPFSSTSQVPTERAIRNRVNAASSKCLSIATHGTRILFSDGDGMLKWMENDGSTVVRRWNINSFSSHNSDFSESVGRSSGMFGAVSGEESVARKLLPLSEEANSGVCVWTGERVGILNFKPSRKISTDIPTGSDEVGMISRGCNTFNDESSEYGSMMRRALERQADEVRFIKDLGLSRSL